MEQPKKSLLDLMETNLKEAEEGYDKSSADQPYIPKYAHRICYDEITTERIAASVDAILNSTNNNGPLIGVALADYLFSECGISDVDCEYIAQLCIELTLRSIKYGASFAVEQVVNPPVIKPASQKVIIFPTRNDQNSINKGDEKQ